MERWWGNTGWRNRPLVYISCSRTAIGVNRPTRQSLTLEEHKTIEVHVSPSSNELSLAHFCILVFINMWCSVTAFICYMLKTTQVAFSSDE
jgi:hypothetical protein